MNSEQQIKEPKEIKLIWCPEKYMIWFDWPIWIGEHQGFIITNLSAN